MEGREQELESRGDEEQENDDRRKGKLYEEEERQSGSSRRGYSKEGQPEAASG